MTDQYKIGDRVALRLNGHVGTLKKKEAGSYKFERDDGLSCCVTDEMICPLPAAAPAPEPVAPVFEVGQEVEALFDVIDRIDWRPAKISALVSGEYYVRFDHVPDCSLNRKIDEIRARTPSPEAGIPVTEQDQHVISIDLEHLRLLKEVYNSALEARSNPTMGSLPWQRFWHAIDRLTEQLNPKPARCEPPDAVKNEPWHLLSGDNSVLVPWMWLEKGLWNNRNDETFDPAIMAEFGWTYHSALKPVPVWSDGEIKCLCGALSSGWTGFDNRVPHSVHFDAEQVLKFARALLSGDKSLIEGKS